MKATRRLGALALAAVFGMGGARAGDAPAGYDFSLEPELTVSREPAPDGRNHRLSTRLPLAATDGGSFVLRFDLDLDTFQHYAHLHLGLVGERAQRIEFDFVRGDDRIARCDFTAENAPGLKARIKPWENVETGRYRAQLSYTADTRTLEIDVSDAEDRAVYASGAVKLAGKADFSAFAMAVLDDGSDVGEILYDPERRALAFRSYVGAEGDYAYMMEGAVGGIVLSRGAAE